MVLDEGLLRLGDSLFHRVQLLRDVDARAAGLDHLDDAAQMAVGAPQALHDSRVGFVDVRLLIHGLKLSPRGGYDKQPPPRARPLQSSIAPDMQTAFLRPVLRLAFTAMIVAAVVLAPGGTSVHHDPAALAGAHSLAELAEQETHGHAHEEVDRPSDEIAGVHEHDAADHAHDTSVLPDGVATAMADLRPRWCRLPPSGPCNGPPDRLDRPPRGSAAA